MPSAGIRTPARRVREMPIRWPEYQMESDMGILDKIVSTVTPEPSEDKKGEARAKARAAANGGGWLWDVLDHTCRSRRRSPR
jgi:hypothetical protein